MTHLYGDERRSSNAERLLQIAKMEQEWDDDGFENRTGFFENCSLQVRNVLAGGK